MPGALRPERCSEPSRGEKAPRGMPEYPPSGSPCAPLREPPGWGVMRPRCSSLLPDGTRCERPAGHPGMHLIREPHGVEVRWEPVELTTARARGRAVP